MLSRISGPDRLIRASGTSAYDARLFLSIGEKSRSAFIEEARVKAEFVRTINFGCDFGELSTPSEETAF